jgi:hypothetical protein
VHRVGVRGIFTPACCDIPVTPSSIPSVPQWSNISTGSVYGGLRSIPRPRISETWIGAGGSGVRITAGTGDSSVLQTVPTGSEAQTAYHETGTGVPPVVERPGLEADHWPPSGAEVRVRGAIPLLPL